jgi:LPXTG-motif cell wall-anchored protein
MMRERNNRLRRMGVGLGTLVAGGLVLVGVLPGSAGAQEAPTGEPVEGNPTCADLGDFDHEFKIDEQPVEGMTYDDPNSDFSVTITDVTEGNPMTFSFVANTPVSAVFVKSGAGGLLYTFDPPTTTGTDLASPNDSISHVSFCWNEETTTTTEGSTTTTEGSTTTTEGSTTTTGHETTTSSIGGTSTTQPGGPTTTAPSVGGTTPSTQPTAGELPRTGSSDTGLLVAVAAGLVACGSALVVATRRMRHS